MTLLSVHDVKRFFHILIKGMNVSEHSWSRAERFRRGNWNFFWMLESTFAFFCECAQRDSNDERSFFVRCAWTWFICIFCYRVCGQWRKRSTCPICRLSLSTVRFIKYKHQVLTDVKSSTATSKFAYLEKILKLKSSELINYDNNNMVN